MNINNVFMQALMRVMVLSISAALHFIQRAVAADCYCPVLFLC